MSRELCSLPRRFLELTSKSMLVTMYYPLLKISSLHLFEPCLLSEKAQEWGLQLDKIADKRKDIWPNLEAVSEAFRAKPKLRAWDERVLRIFIVCFILLSFTFVQDWDHSNQEHGLRSLPTAEYPDVKDGLTLKCTRKQEAVRHCCQIRANERTNK